MRCREGCFVSCFFDILHGIGGSHRDWLRVKYLSLD